VPVLRAIAYTAFGLAGVLVIYGMNGGGVLMFTSAVTAALSGVVFLAIDRIISLLIEIRDRLGAASTKLADRPDLGGQASDVATTTPTGTLRTAAEIGADLAQMRQRLGQ
jgi:hypothetical protein